MAEALPLVGQRLSAHWVIRTLKLMLPVADNMKDDVALLATVTLVGVLLQGGLVPVWEVVDRLPLQPILCPSGSWGRELGCWKA